MFKSIEYNLILYLLLLMVSLSAASVLFVHGEVVYGVICILVILFSLVRLFKNYRKFNRNILFLLNAMENGDYSFDFAVNRLSLREKELNRMLNRIKEILVKTRREIIENEEFLSIIVESVSTGIIIVDGDGFVYNVNHSATRLLGLEGLSHLNQLRNIDYSYPFLFKNLKQGENPPIKITTEREETELSLRLSEIIVSGKPLRIITLHNIGNELEAREMESWISLIRVMTHEIMNSIAPITSLSEALLFSFRSHHAETANESLYTNTIDALNTIHTTTRGLLNFVESYRQFTRIPKPQFAPTTIKSLLERVICLQSGEPENKYLVEFAITGEDATTQLYADESQIFQVLVNLVKNATESFDKEDSISSGAPKIEFAIILSPQQITIEVRNNGAPIPEEVLPHIFVPFFTTKTSGSGIGLSLSRYIMRLHGGNLRHHTHGEWTVFEMIFPQEI